MEVLPYLIGILSPKVKFKIWETHLRLENMPTAGHFFKI
jgi:hypothetical protein